MSSVNAIMRWEKMLQCEARLLYEVNQRALGTRDMIFGEGEFFSSLYQLSTDILTDTSVEPTYSKHDLILQGFPFQVNFYRVGWDDWFDA